MNSSDEPAASFTCHRGPVASLDFARPGRLIEIRAVRHGRPPSGSARVAAVATRFGLATCRPAELTLQGVRLRLGRGRLILVQGPSGVGKSFLLDRIAVRLPGARRVERVRFRNDRCVLDQVLAGGNLPGVLRLLMRCALGEPQLWFRRFTELSDGERFRARLARAIGLQRTRCPSRPLLCDEFGSALDRRAALAVAYNLRREVTRTGLCLIAATTRDDVEPDLQPDQIVRFTAPGALAVTDRRPRPRPMSLTRRLHIARGGRADYRRFSAMHYRGGDELGFVDRVFLMREGRRGEPVGIVVYAHPPLELALRNRATCGRFIRNADRLNRELRILRRLVIIPELRGCGLGRLMVRRTLRRVGTPYVECLANLGDCLPVFQRAGMRRVGRCPLPQSVRVVEKKLRDLRVDPGAPTFARQLARRPRLRRLVAEVIYRWYCGWTTCAAARSRVQRQSAETLARLYGQLRGSRPVYFLWERPRRRAQARDAAG